MNNRWRAAIAASVVGAAIYGLTPSKAQEPDREMRLPAASLAPLSIEHPECTFFGPERERFLPRINRDGSDAGRITRQFQAMTVRPSVVRSQSFAAAQTGKSNLIDQYIWADLQANNITPAGKTTDFEFIRRVTLDLTGRIPTPDRVTGFTASIDPGKRAALVEELLAKPQWVDKWTMYFGDLYKNTAN